MYYNSWYDSLSARTVTGFAPTFEGAIVSRQAKQEKRKKQSAEFTALHKQGQRGPNTRNTANSRGKRKKSEANVMVAVMERVKARFPDVKFMVLR